ncbi:MAG: hypothetical protein ACRDSJ_13490, partial [Rubrobacteraceae bacterium]
MMEVMDVERIKKMSGAFERVAGRTGEMRKLVFDHAVAIQERNAKFAREWHESLSDEVRHQVESNRAVTQELVERTEKQRDAYQALVQESVDAYMDFA